MSHFFYLLTGIFFGFVLTKTEVISWFRIQEMFRFQSFHMYGIIGSALVVGIISVQLIRRFQKTTFDGEVINLDGKPLTYGSVFGGVLFGLGWALTGACPGPIFALIGGGHISFILVLISALGGTWVYGLFKEKLPH